MTETLLQRLPDVEWRLCLDAIHRYVKHYSGEQKRGKVSFPTRESYEALVTSTAEIDLRYGLS